MATGRLKKNNAPEMYITRMVDPAWPVNDSTAAPKDDMTQTRPLAMKTSRPQPIGLKHSPPVFNIWICVLNFVHNVYINKGVITPHISAEIRIEALYLWV